MAIYDSLDEQHLATLNKWLFSIFMLNDQQLATDQSCYTRPLLYMHFKLMQVKNTKSGLYFLNIICKKLLHLVGFMLHHPTHKLFT